MDKKNDSVAFLPARLFIFERQNRKVCENESVAFLPARLFIFERQNRKV